MEEIKLVLNKIPNNLTETEIKSILDKSIKSQYTDFQYIKPSHKYSPNYNNYAFLTVNNMETRIKLIDFLEQYEIITKNGKKHHLGLDICVMQLPNEKGTLNDDKINNTYKDLNHFKKFKEAFEKDELVKFKQDNMLKGKEIYYDIYDDVEEVKIIEKKDVKDVKDEKEGRRTGKKDGKEKKIHIKMKENKENKEKDKDNHYENQGNQGNEVTDQYSKGKPYQNSNSYSSKSYYNNNYDNVYEKNDYNKYKKGNSYYEQEGKPYKSSNNYYNNDEYYENSYNKGGIGKNYSYKTSQYEGYDSQYNDNYNYNYNYSSGQYNQYNQYDYNNKRKKK